MNWYRTSQEDEDDLGMADAVRDVLAQGTWDDASSVIMKMASDLCRGAFLSRTMGQVSEDVSFRVETMGQQFPNVHIRNYIAEGLSWMKQVAVEASLSAISGMDFHEAGHHSCFQDRKSFLNSFMDSRDYTLLPFGAPPETFPVGMPETFPG